ncbi:MAG: tetratricopeptide repeat protein [Deltaproteobacteria bacterium]|nr:tetratricopeptide repeat protein [Deltaproteobacteria bacterium]
MSINKPLYFVTILFLYSILSSCALLYNAKDKNKPLTQIDRAWLMIEVAKGALHESDATGALQTLADAEKLAPNLPELYHVRALAYFAKHDLQKAIHEAKQAVFLSPTYSDANNTLGKLYLDLGMYSEAEKPLLLASEDSLYRDAYKAFTNLGILYYRKEEYKKAQTSLQKAVLELPQGACVAHYYLGHIQLYEGNLREAQKEYDQAAQKFCAGFAEAHLAIGMMYERTREYDKARRKFLEIKQNFANTKYSDQAIEQLKYLP